MKLSEIIERRLSDMIDWMDAYYQHEDDEEENEQIVSLAKSLENKIAELEAQIEAMKSCCNCKHSGMDIENVISLESCETCDGKNNWELRG